MPRYIATQTREVVIDAPSTAAARILADRALSNTLKPTDIPTGSSVRVKSPTLKVEKAD